MYVTLPLLPTRHNYLTNSMLSGTVGQISSKCISLWKIYGAAVHWQRVDVSSHWTTIWSAAEWQLCHPRSETFIIPIIWWLAHCQKNVDIFTSPTRPSTVISVSALTCTKSVGCKTKYISCVLQDIWPDIWDFTLFPRSECLAKWSTHSPQYLVYIPIFS